ncbi:O-acetylhomoserine aminocarboxypropyltransferase/cysteine synthase|uniref:O-acetylhomoserine sulfhydrylase n=1 Tax=Dendrosporobacter quercicolus TaxID=146817 RepID=A0A1G9S414_9FIRM|nr:O-acetylhomoserine aminocarboxypropyltransferase/cysteine synthase family protein [Dendrosporobacter quercicolus]NSL49474.1 O-acetylhomoserine aminocarboxypropyltransferase/cysteine synthase [Dendrosporobacter quercicolus DSM 1736]SDM30144.1 O-acetylhomoserine sulfhydrylase [Dendrosporobacter quercicolus]
MKSERNFGFETKMVHAGHIPDTQHGARAVPIYQTSSYVFYDADHAAELFDLKQYGHIYSRISNPTVAVFEERMAALEGATGAVATASGMAAQLAAFMTLLQPGDELAASSHLYGGSITQITHTLKRLGVTVTYVDPTDSKAWERAITPKTRALYGELIGNPRGSILDLEAVAALAEHHHIPLIIDNTIATPYLCRPMDFGAAITVYSATKFIGGHGNSLGGVVLDSGKFDYSGFPSIADPSPQYHNLRFYDTFGHYGFLMKARVETLRDTGGSLSPMNAFLLLQGVETLSLRLDRQVDNALQIARFLEQHPQVAWVAYAGLASHPQHLLAVKYLPKGAGAVLSFGLKKQACEDVRQTGKRFIEHLKLFSHLANIGDVRSLVIHPGSTTHQQLTDEELRDCGVGPELIRLSVGIENLEDLIWDLDQAFQTLA